MSETKEINYWKLQKDELIRELNSSAMGLDDTEAARRLEEYGLNEVSSTRRRTSFSARRSALNIYVELFCIIHYDCGYWCRKGWKFRRF
jgi:hypothetical protein